MTQKNDRRSFLGKLLLGATSAAALPLIGWNEKDEETMDNAPQGHPILRVRPLGFQWETADPFLFCVHHEDFYPKGNAEMGPVGSLEGRQIGSDFHLKDGWRMYHGRTVPGFPGHPHRGFETITVVRKGLVDHADSLGASGRYGDGDVQWMTAGKGIQHSEMFPLLREDADNPMELFQIWLNLPAKSKMVEPHFKMLWSENIPHKVLTDEAGKKVEIEVIAGALFDAKSQNPPPNSWAAAEENHVGVFNMLLEPGARFTLPATASGVNRTLYLYEGKSVHIAETAIPEYHAVDVQSDAALDIVNHGADSAKILILQGRPIGEPVVQHGPFVMNTREEIQQAFNDYHATQFGGWPWPRYDQVHDRSNGRFAQHADGTKETRG